MIRFNMWTVNVIYTYITITIIKIIILYNIEQHCFRMLTMTMVMIMVMYKVIVYGFSDV